MPAYKAKNKTWFVQFKYKDWEGKYRSVTKRGFDTKREALDWERDFLEEKAGNIEVTLVAFSKTYLADIKSRLKPDTFEVKNHIITRWIIPYFGHMNLIDITAADVMKWQNKLIETEKPEGGKLSKSYLKTIHNQLSAMFNHAVKYYDLPKNPAAIVGNMGTDKQVKTGFWTKEQYDLFAKASSTDITYFYIFEVLYWCGLREGELLALTLDDIDFENKEININKTYYVLKGKPYVTTPKTENSIRTVTMPDFICDELRDYIKMDYKPKGSDRLFPVPKSGLQRAIHKYAKKAGIPEIRVHDLRHSHVSLLIHYGWNAVAIGARVGHSSAYITFHYAHMFPDVQGNIADSLNQIKKG